VDYSSLHHGDDGGDVGEGIDPSGGGSNIVPPLIFLVLALFRCFGVSATLSSKERSYT
jgi:hypothetical protein